MPGSAWQHCEVMAKPLQSLCLPVLGSRDSPSCPCPHTRPTGTERFLWVVNTLPAILGNLMWGLVASLLRKHELWNALFPGTIGQPDTEAVPDFKCRKLCGHCCDVDVQNLAWWNSWPLFQKAHFKMSDKPDKSMRPDDHRRKWDHVEYEKNAQARLELEEAIEKSREGKDRSVRNVIWWILSYSLLDLSLFLGTFWMAVVKRCHCSIILCQGWARARERQTESAWVQGTGSSFN